MCRVVGIVMTRLAALLVAVALLAVGCGGQPFPRAASTTAPPATGGNPTTAGTTTVPPTLGPGSESDAAAGNQALFNDNRAQLEAALRAQPDPKLTGFSFNTQTNMISAVFGYEHPAQESRSRYDSFAWHVGQTLSDSFWFPQLVQSLQSQHIDVAFLPTLRVQLDSVSYQCPAAVEIAVDAHRISQHDWLHKCAA
jgi:hypothetical protein